MPATSITSTSTFADRLVREYPPDVFDPDPPDPPEEEESGDEDVSGALGVVCAGVELVVTAVVGADADPEDDEEAEPKRLLASAQTCLIPFTAAGRSALSEERKEVWFVFWKQSTH